jgi:hypothetical protein
MDISRSVTATFDRLKLVRTTDGTTPKSYYGLVQNAFKTAVNTDVIQATQNTFKEDLTLNQSTATDVITLKGGYDTVYTDIPTGVTTIQGKLTIQSGKLIVSGVAIRPTL